ncbi:MAG TPA: aminoglycoside phosphotransferase family protein [Streptomyces sp.]|nr:aminoglycoside phosphotransferase family protein [Streptomyces sp.]
MVSSDPNPGISARAEEAVRIATEAGRRLGLTVDGPRVLHDVFNVLVHLAPSPVVVRVPSLVEVEPGEQVTKQRHELAVAGWLADRGVRVVAPSPLVPREPFAWQGRSLTFWEFVSEEKDESPLSDELMMERYIEQTGWVAELHAHLADYPGELPLLAPIVPATGDALRGLRDRPEVLAAADLERAEREYEVLAAVVADLNHYFPRARVQALHGDAPYYNILRTREGHLFSDFEEVTAGPVEWDLTMAGPQAVAVYEQAGGQRVDRGLLELMEQARLLQIVSALAFTDRMPELAPQLEPMVDQWRALPELDLKGIGAGLVD